GRSEPWRGYGSDFPCTALVAETTPRRPAPSSLALPQVPAAGGGSLVTAPGRESRNRRKAAAVAMLAARGKVEAVREVCCGRVRTRLSDCLRPRSLSPW
ncbi:unnamed protein product, partial [Ectocarpus sp. 12 AP-2014]